MNDTLIKQYERLIYKISNSFYGVNKEDLIQSGFLGLIKAYRNYDKTKGTKFSTYAYNYIYGEMYELYSKNRNIKLNKKCLKIYRDLTRAKEMLSQKYNREVSLFETCKYLKLDVSEVKEILNMIVEPKSIEEDLVTIPYEDNIDTKILIGESMDSLNDVERRVFKERFLNDFSQEETAKTLGLSQAKVSRIESKGKAKIKQFVKA